MNIMNLLLVNKSAVQQGLAVPLPKSNMELHVIPEVFFEVTGKSGEWHPLVISSMAGWKIPYEWSFWKQNHLLYFPLLSEGIHEYI